MRIQALVSDRTLSSVTPFDFTINEFDDFKIVDGLLYVLTDSGYQFIFPWELVSLVSIKVTEQTEEDDGV